MTFTTGITDDGAAVTLASDRRTDGLILDALLAVRPDSDLIAKVVRGLQAGQGGDGRWDNVQENAFILLALRHYFDAFEGTDPDFVARVWVGERTAGGQEFAGRSTATNVISIPTAEVIAAGDPAVTIGHEGTGRLYYRIGLRTAPASLDLAPLDRGFVVARTYEAVDDPADVTRDADGTWRIRAGARVRVRLTMVAESQRTHVALVDPLPAGLEIVNPTLATAQEAPAAEDDAERRPEPWHVVVGPVVRPPERARRPGRGLRRLPRCRRVRLLVHRPGDDPRRVRRAADAGRGDLRPRDVRPGRDRPRGGRLTSRSCSGRRVTVTRCTTRSPADDRQICRTAGGGPGSHGAMPLAASCPRSPSCCSPSPFATGGRPASAQAGGDLPWPDRRFAPCGAVDPEAGVLYAFGGRADDDTTHLADLWALDLGDGRHERPAWSLAAPAGALGGPPPVRTCAAAWEPSTDRLLVFGGWNGTVHDGVLRAFDPASGHVDACCATRRRAAPDRRPAGPASSSSTRPAGGSCCSAGPTARTSTTSGCSTWRR